MENNLSKKLTEEEKFLDELLETVNSDWDDGSPIKISTPNREFERLKLVRQIGMLAHKAKEFDFIRIANILKIIKFSLITENQDTLESIMKVYYKEEVHADMMKKVSQKGKKLFNDN